MGLLAIFELLVVACRPLSWLAELSGLGFSVVQAHVVHIGLLDVVKARSGRIEVRDGPGQDRPRKLAYYTCPNSPFSHVGSRNVATSLIVRATSAAL